MPVNLLILEATTNTQHNKVRALGILFISSNMIFMPSYLKLHSIFIALLTRAILRLMGLYWGGFSAQAQYGSPGEGGWGFWGWCQSPDYYSLCCDAETGRPTPPHPTPHRTGPSPGACCFLGFLLCSSVLFECPLAKRAL